MEDVTAYMSKKMSYALENENLEVSQWKKQQNTGIRRMIPANTV